MKSITHIILYSFLLGALAFVLQQHSELQNKYQVVFNDNQKLVEQLEEQNKTIYRLMDNGWSEEKARDFVEQGCLMYLEVRG